MLSLKSRLQVDASFRPKNGTLSGHTGWVNALLVLPNGLLASGSDDSTIKLWDVDRQACVSTLSGHTSFVTALVVLPNGVLASGSVDHTIKLWSVDRQVCSDMNISRLMTRMSVLKSLTFRSIND